MYLPKSIPDRRVALAPHRTESYDSQVFVGNIDAPPGR
jgi:hypothetical protein